MVLGVIIKSLLSTNNCTYEELPSCSRYTVHKIFFDTKTDHILFNNWNLNDSPANGLHVEVSVLIKTLNAKCKYQTKPTTGDETIIT